MKNRDPYTGDAPVPNVWFTTSDEKEGDIEVSAWVPPVRSSTNEKIVIVGVGAPSDVHITPEEAGIAGARLQALKDKAAEEFNKMKGRN
jgi:hypothetical protein